MDKQRMELLYPVLTSKYGQIERKQDPNIILSDMLHVNQIVDKRPRTKLNQKQNLQQPLNRTSLTNPKQYSSIKQEHQFKLNRDRKLKKNQEWVELFHKNFDDNNNNKSNQSWNNSNYLKQLNETNKQIDEATTQLAQINMFLETKKKTEMIKKTTKPEIKSEPNARNQLLSDKEKKINEALKRKEKQIRQKKINNTLTLVDERLKKTKQKFFTNDYETNRIDSVIKRPNYKSIKEIIKMGEDKLPTIKASKFIDDDDDLNDSKRYLLPKSNEMKRNFTSPAKKIDCATNFNYDSLGNDDTKQFHANVPLKQTKVQKNVAETKSIGLDTKERRLDPLRESIMKSEFLKKEFCLEPDLRIAIKKKEKSEEGPEKHIGIKTSDWLNNLNY